MSHFPNKLCWYHIVFEDDVKLLRIFSFLRGGHMICCIFLIHFFYFFFAVKRYPLFKEEHFKESTTLKLKMMQVGEEIWVITFFQSKFDVKRMNFGKNKKISKGKGT